MARRDNQGIQIAMIVFILTTLLFMVTTYFGYSSTTTLRAELEKATTEKNDAASQRDAKVRLMTDLKSKIGVDPATDDSATEQQITELVTTTYGQGLPPENQSLIGIIENRNTRVGDLNQQLSAANKQVQDLRSQLAEARKIADTQLVDAQKRENEAHQLYQKAEETLNSFRTESETKLSSLSDQRDQMKAELDRTKAQTGQQVATAESERAKAIRRARLLKEQIDEVNRDTPDRYDGRVVGSVPATNTVILSVGQLDGVRPKTTFGIYDAEDSNVRTAVKKASVEVTKVLGKHSCEARVTDIDYTNPIVQNDYIYSPIWSPGLKQGIALVGPMDFDQDGLDDRGYIKSLITNNGGEVDAEDVDGRQVGKMDVNTRYIVIGEGQLTGGANEMVNEARDLSIERMSVNELLDLISPPGRARVVTYGGAPRKGDFAPEARSGVIRASTGSTSFRKRTPTPRRNRPTKFN